MATENIKVVKIDTGQAQTSVKDLRNELKELRNTLLSTEKGTEEYNNAMKQAAEIQHTLKEQMEEVNASAMDFGQIASNCTKAVGGMVAGFQAAKATMNLFGIENEAVLQSLEKMQNLMAITQALPSIDNGIKAFKRLGLAIKGATAGMSGLKKAIISTGLGALAVALGLLVANWDKVTDAMKRWGIIHQTTAEKLEEEKKKAESLKQKLEEAQKAYKDWEKQTAVNNLSSEAREEYNELNNQIEGYQKKLQEIDVERAKASRERDKELFAEGLLIHEQMKAAKIRQNEILADKNLTKEAAEEAKKAAEAAKEAAEERKKAAEQEKKEIENLKKKYGELAEDIKLFGATDYQKDLATIQKAEDKALETIQKANEKKIISEEQYQKDRVAIEKYYSKLREDAAREEAERQRKASIELIDTSYQLEQAKLQKQYDEKLISEKDFTDRKKELLETYVQDYVDNIQFMLDTENGLTDEQILDLTTKINEARSMLKPEETTDESLTKGISEAINASAAALNDFSDNPAWGNILKNVATLTANWDNLNEQIKEGGNKAFSAYAQIAAAGLGAVATMLNGLAAEQDTSNKEGFESQKKLQIAGATMSMLAGITSAWASSMQLGPVAGPIMGAILSAMMLGTGIAQITKIKNTKFDDKGSIGGTSPNAGAVASVIAPVQYTRDVDNASIEGAIKNHKVYVTETDITDTQNKVSVTENEARY